MNREILLAIGASVLTGIGVMVWDFVGTVDKLEHIAVDRQKHLIRVEHNENQLDDHENRLRYVERNYKKKDTPVPIVPVPEHSHIDDIKFE